ncbi:MULTISPECIES: sugar ABC transporter permease [Vagococcus]|uniref:Multiple sugar ABC transporter, membrane-spanning permease protein MsmF n=1 Tax=Vagococcus fluvialis bH819 TaxID=1255619 RepID=A0A1X6WKE7_9ENTE|nr:MULTISPECIES: sugar ABC transporter permease [Vagococcus]SLM84794.1 Multiple sugar ABC transporter, membrane-spanning permease protein MsmF [Vagococcus fluvialis bH819]HCM89746.1 sugar ABC transporter permease [Vagococcus sp.]
MTKNHNKQIIIFLSLPILLLVIFGILPIINFIVISFTSWNGMGTTFEWVGLDNYTTLVKNPVYWQALRVNTYYLVSGILQMIIAYYFAVILSEKTKGKNFFKSLFLLPSLISSMAVAMIFRLFFSPNGAFDQLLSFLHLDQWITFWLGNPDQVNITLASISLWRNLGISFILYYGAIQSIPREYNDVCLLEGASLWQKTRWITIPQTIKVIYLNSLLLIIGVISVFDIPFILTNGSNGSTTIVVQTMKLAFEQKKYGLASGLSVCITLMIVLLSSLLHYSKNKGGHKK